MCCVYSMEKIVCFLEEGTVELSLAGREAVSSENSGRMFQAEGGRQEPWFWLLPGVCIWCEVPLVRQVGPDSQIRMFCSQCKTIPAVCQQGHGQLNLWKGIIVGGWQTCKVTVHFNRMGILAIFLLIQLVRDLWSNQSSDPWLWLFSKAVNGQSAQQADSVPAPTAAVSSLS